MQARKLHIVLAGPVPTCPKCGAERGNAQACARCGLAVAYTTRFLARREADVPTELVAAWEVVREHWYDIDAHDAVLDAARRHAQYAWLAARYRDYLRHRGPEQLAERQLARVGRTAEVTFSLAHPPRQERHGLPYRGVRWLLALIVVALLAGGLFAKARANAAAATGAAMKR